MSNLSNSQASMTQELKLSQLPHTKWGTLSPAQTVMQVHPRPRFSVWSGRGGRSPDRRKLRSEVELAVPAEDYRVYRAWGSQPVETMMFSGVSNMDAARFRRVEGSCRQDQLENGFNFRASGRSLQELQGQADLYG